MKHYGIIGNPLGHSYSEGYFTDTFIREHIAADYTPYELSSIHPITALLAHLDGFNVTYPYKQTIIPYLHSIDPIAQQIGAVNVVHHGKGYNTDWIGFRDSLLPLLQADDKRALLLGTGGVSKAIQFALHDLGIEYTLVSRSVNPMTRALTYEQVTDQIMASHTIIINCTPLGMHPYELDKPSINYEALTPQHLLYDCIYNPAKTLFLQEGDVHNCRTKNGLEMLHLQADAAWKIWNSTL